MNSLQKRTLTPLPLQDSLQECSLAVDSCCLKKVTFLCRALAAKDFGVAAFRAKMLPVETLIQCATGHKSCSPGC